MLMSAKMNQLYLTFYGKSPEEARIFSTVPMLVHGAEMWGWKEHERRWWRNVIIFYMCLVI